VWRNVAGELRRTSADPPDDLWAHGNPYTTRPDWVLDYRAGANL
jgi:hypothetical protein